MIKQISKNRFAVICIFLLIIFILAIVCYLHNRLYYPKIIWIYWDNEELPHNIDLIKKHNKDKLKGWTVKYLNINTLKKYIPESAYNPNYDNLVSPNKSDWIRLYLVYTYGGCWLDAGIILNSATELNKIYDDTVNKKSYMTVFRTSDETATFRHSSGVDLPLVIDSWFILAPQRSYVVKAWLDEFTYAMDYGFLNYKRKIIKEQTNISKIHFKNEEDTYLMVHMCIQHVLQKKLTHVPSLIILDSSTSMLKIQKICNWKDDCIADKINNDPASKTLPFIKLTGSNRESNIDKYFMG